MYLYYHFVASIGIEFGIRFSLELGTVFYYEIVGIGTGFNDQTRETKLESESNGRNSNTDNNNKQRINPCSIQRRFKQKNTSSGAKFGLRKPMIQT